MYISILEILFILFYFSMWLYSLVNRKITLSFNNSKLNEYEKKYNLQNITDILGRPKYNKFNSFKGLVQKNIINQMSPNKNKQEVIILLITLTIIIFIINIRFRYIFSNFIYIKILNKNFDLVSFFNQKYLFFKLIYFSIYNICIYSITRRFLFSNFFYKIYYILNYKNINNKIKNQNNLIIKNEIVIGRDTHENIIYIDKKGLYQNVYITGSIGTGKTSGAILNILDGLIKNGINGLIIDVKGNFADNVYSILKKYNLQKKLKVINLDNNFKYNPLSENISSVEISGMLKKILKLTSENNNSDSFWLDKVESYIRDFIPLIKIYNKTINFTEIHKLTIDHNYLKEKIKYVKDYIFNNPLSDDILFNLNSSISNLENEYLNLDSRTLNIIRAEITRITSIFISDYKINEKFCTTNDNIDFYNNIIVLSLGIGENKILTKVLATYLKLQFQKIVLSNKIKEKSIFFICDEFQEICNEEDGNFFSLSREFKCINVVSTQSYSSLINALKNENVSRVIIQNLVNKIWFRNDDTYTVNEIIKQIGKEDKIYKNINISENGQNTRYNILNNNFFDYKTGISKGFSYNIKKEYKIDEQNITTKLNTFEAMCILSNGYNMKFIDKVIFKRWECCDEKDRR